MASRLAARCALGAVLALSACGDGGPTRPARPLVALFVEGLVVGEDGSPAVVLRAETGVRLALGLTRCEAENLYVPLYEATVPRPVTHALLVVLLDSLALAVDGVHLERAGPDSAMAVLVLTGARRLEVTAFPADALNLALRTGAPVLAEAALVEELRSQGSAGPADRSPAGAGPRAAGRLAGALQDRPDLVGVRVAEVVTTVFSVFAVLLVDYGERFVLPVFVDPCQGLAIHAGLHGVDAAVARPHELTLELLRRSGAAVAGVSIHDIRDEVFIADLRVGRGERSFRLDCRPSDGIALAQRSGAPVEVAGFLLAAYGEDPALYAEVLTPP